MRFRHGDGTTVHLSYCSNVHPAEDVEGIVAQLDRFAGPVRRAVGADRLGLGLWLPARAAQVLAADPAAVAHLRSRLAAHRLEVVTLNGFPFGGFHARVVKAAVYRPDWCAPERLAYTLDLAEVLAGLLPDDVPAGSISTLPLGWRRGWSAASTRVALAALRRLAVELAVLHDRTGRTIRVGLEPEPGCAVEETAQAAEVLGGEVDPAWVGVCLDACHLAVQFEEASEAVASLAAAGVPVVKAQVSAALRVADPSAGTSRGALATYVEPRFLHQTRARLPGPGGRVVGMDDLDEALDGGLPTGGEWRTHFHVPVHWDAGAGDVAGAAGDPAAEGAAGVTTTQPELRDTLAVLVGGPVPVTTHLDVETYTWSVLPPERRPADAAGLVAGLAEELRWTRHRLAEAGLVEQSAAGAATTATAATAVAEQGARA
jgi:Xylose isomerase-like TIM barrel